MQLILSPETTRLPREYRLCRLRTAYQLMANSTIASTPYMAFGDFYMFVGHLNSAGTCMGTNRYDPRSTYMISSVAQGWFSTASAFPFLPNSPIFTNGINYTNFYANYESQVSSQTSTWDERVVVTEINDDLFAWLTKQPAVLSSVPHIVSCSPVSAAGAPNLHVRVSFLTTSSAVTSTTNAIYFNAATTTSAAPASKTLVVATSTKASTVDVPSPSTADTPSGKPPNQPTQSAASQGAGTSPEAPSDQPENQTSQHTTNQVDGASSGQTASPATASVPFDSPPDQSTASPGTIASLEAPSNGPPETPTQQSASNQGSENPPVAPSQNAGSLLAQSTTNGAGATSGVLSQGDVSEVTSDTRNTQTREPVVVVIGDVTATALSPSIIPTESDTPDTGGHVVVVPGSAQLTQAFGSTDASPSQIISNGQTLQVSATAMPTAPAASVVGNSFEPVSSGAYAIAGQTLNPGGSAIEIFGTTYSLQASGGIVVNGNTVPISTVAPQRPSTLAPVVFGMITATPVASDGYVVADQTLSRGGSAIEVSGTTYSLPPSADNAVINGQAAPISTIHASPQPPATVVIGGVTAKPESSGAYYLVADQTLSPGGSALEVSGVTYSLPTSGANIVINGATSVPAPTDVHTVSAVVLGSATAVPLLAGGYVVGSQVINPGGSAVEISGTTYSLPASGASVVVDGKTTAIQAIATANDGAITLGSQVYTAVAASATPLVIASQTLIPGGKAITVSGTVFSLPADATGSIVIDGQTTALATAASGGAGLSIGSRQLSFTPLNSGIVIASKTLYPGGPAITVNGETLSISSDGTAVVIQSGTSASTEGLGDYIWQGIAPVTSSSKSESGSTSSTVGLSGTSSGAIISSTQAVASKGTGAASSAQTSTSDAGGQQSALSYRSATTALVICLFAIVLL